MAAVKYENTKKSTWVIIRQGSAMSKGGFCNAVPTNASTDTQTGGPIRQTRDYEYSVEGMAYTAGSYMLNVQAVTLEAEDSALEVPRLFWVQSLHVWASDVSVGIGYSLESNINRVLMGSKATTRYSYPEIDIVVKNTLTNPLSQQSVDTIAISFSGESGRFDFRLSR